LEVSAGAGDKARVFNALHSCSEDRPTHCVEANADPLSNRSAH
jgi:hypothetical protein